MIPAATQAATHHQNPSGCHQKPSKPIRRRPAANRCHQEPIKNHRGPIENPPRTHQKPHPPAEGDCLTGGRHEASDAAPQDTSDWPLTSPVAAADRGKSPQAAIRLQLSPLGIASVLRACALVYFCARWGTLPIGRSAQERQRYLQSSCIVVAVVAHRFQGGPWQGLARPPWSRD